MAGPESAAVLDSFDDMIEEMEITIPARADAIVTRVEDPNATYPYEVALVTPAAVAPEKSDVGAVTAALLFSDLTFEGEVLFMDQQNREARGNKGVGFFATAGAVETLAPFVALHGDPVVRAA
jgi:hypothetical protein